MKQRRADKKERREAPKPENKSKKAEAAERPAASTTTTREPADGSDEVEELASVAAGDGSGGGPDPLVYAVLIGALGLAAAAGLTLIPAFGDPLRFSDLRFGMLATSLALLLGLGIASLG